ncbi:MAG: hypothetical protein IJ859_02265 [Synergistaceae bacterium]|nr:hypothetical protein [Synergistaceae bacterium]
MDTLIEEIKIKTNESSDKKYVELTYDDIKNFSFEITQQNREAYKILANA